MEGLGGVRSWSVWLFVLDTGSVYRQPLLAKYYQQKRLLFDDKEENCARHVRCRNVSLISCA